MKKSERDFVPFLNISLSFLFNPRICKLKDQFWGCVHGRLNHLTVNCFLLISKLLKPIQFQNRRHTFCFQNDLE